MKNLFDIKDNVTVITGGTGILGRTIAKYLACNGAKVIILGRKVEVGQQIVSDVESASPQGTIEFMATDVLNKEIVEKIALIYLLNTDALTHFSMLQVAICLELQ